MAHVQGSGLHSGPHPASRPAPFAVLTALSAALLAVLLVWGLGEGRLLDGSPVWAKPTKFALSFVVHFGTLALIWARLAPAVQQGFAGRAIAAAATAAFVTEMAYMTFQAAQGEASHFNASTPFHMAMYAVMGLGALVLVAAPVALAWLARRDPAARLGPATRAGVWLGAWLSGGLTLIAAGYLSNSGGHFVGQPSASAAVLPLVGWSAEVGDLRPAHFLALHALQALPLAGLWLDRRGAGPGALRWLALGWGLVTLALFVQALMGLPLLRL